MSKMRPSSLPPLVIPQPRAPGPVFLASYRDPLFRFEQPMAERAPPPPYPHEHGQQEQQEHLRLRDQKQQLQQQQQPHDNLQQHPLFRQQAHPNRQQQHHSLPPPRPPQTTGHPFRTQPPRPPPADPTARAAAPPQAGPPLRPHPPPLPATSTTAPPPPTAATANQNGPRPLPKTDPTAEIDPIVALFQFHHPCLLPPTPISNSAAGSADLNTTFQFVGGCPLPGSLRRVPANKAAGSRRGRGGSISRRGTIRGNGGVSRGGEMGSVRGSVRANGRVVTGRGGMRIVTDTGVERRARDDSYIVSAIPESEAGDSPIGPVRGESILSREGSFYRWPRHTVIGMPQVGEGDELVMSPIVASPVAGSPVFEALSLRGGEANSPPSATGTASASDATSPDTPDSPSSVYDEFGGNPFDIEEEEENWGEECVGLRDWNVDGILEEYVERERDALRELWGAVDTLLGPGSGLGDYDATSTIDSNATIGWDRLVLA